MQCPRCRAENRERRRFCGECGFSFALKCPSCGFINESRTREQAREHLTTATTMYSDMGMRFWLEQAEAEMKELC
jgi:phage FluMu protein Com